jgi:hypothetical protein
MSTVITPFDAVMIAELRREELLREAEAVRLGNRVGGKRRPTEGRLVRLLRAVATRSWSIAPRARADSVARL